MKKLLLAILIFVGSNSFAQFELKGTIVDSTTMKPVIGAHVKIVGSPEIQITDNEGIFRFSNQEKGNKVLEASHVSYIHKKIIVAVPIAQSLVIRLDPSIIQINPVVVTATRSENKLLDVPSKISYISSKQISMDPGKSLDDALQYSSGIYVNRNFGILSSKSTVSARGLSSKDQSRMLVLVDGVPVNKTDGGGVNWNLFNKETIESMEVLKGPGSAIYGNNAMAGVISINTKKPTQAYQGSVGIEYGTFNTKIARLNLMGSTHQKSEKGFYWLISGLWSKSDGYMTYPENLRSQYSVNTYLNEVGSLAKIGYDIDKNNSIEFNFTFYDDKHGGGDKVYEKDGTYSKYNTYRYALTYKGKSEKSNWMVNAFWLDENYGKLNESLKDQTYQLYDVTSLRRDFGLLSSYSTSLTKSNKLTFGLDFREGSVDAADIYYSSTDKVINQGKMDFMAGYFQDEWLLMNQKLHINIGTRFDYAKFHDGAYYIENPSQAIQYLSVYQIPTIQSAEWSSISPKASALYELSKVARTYLSYSIGFRPPVLDDMCRSGKISGGFKVVNPALKPEHIQSVEWGWKLNWENGLSINPSVWYSLGTDFMYYVSTGDSAYTTGFWSPVLKSLNISKVQLYGFDFDASWQINKHFTLLGNYAYTQNEILKYTLPADSKLTDLTGKHLTDVPNHQVVLGGTWKNKYVNLIITNKLVGSQWVNDANIPDEKYGLPEKYEAYSLTDVKIWKMIGTHISLGASMINVFDKVFLTSKSQLNPGRMVFGELKVIF